jgi:LuxR family maltose regulon positive regulatory protein
VEPLLTTKFYIPPNRPGIVPRPQLVEQLNQGLPRKLTLISAPAGFGKTTLLSEWVEELRRAAAIQSQSIYRIAWLSLDEGDNDPTSFLTYFAAALNQIEGIKTAIGDGAVAMLQSPQPLPTETVLTALINDITAIPDGIVFVLDDYHSIESPSVDEALTFLLQRLPVHMHLVIATRVDPQLPLARLRARGQLTELRAADLRFTASEVAEFLRQVMGLDLAAEDIAALENRTEGWIAGLQLAAISMRGYNDAASFIKSFTGSHRFVMDYLIEEVLEQQPDDIQTFLLQTAVLGRISGALCDALTGQVNGQATLEMLERANLFIVPLDQERRWYRYHQLFSDLLRRRLRQTQPGQEPILHRRACKWYAKNGFADEAIEHALRAEDFERAIYLIRERADAAWGQGEHAKLRRWLFKLPIEWVATEPYLCIFHAWYLFTSGEYDAAGESLHTVEQALESITDQATETESQKQDSRTGFDGMKLRGRLAAIRAFMDAHRGDVPGMVRHATQALEYLPEQDQTWRSLIAIVLGDIHGFKGDMAAAYQARFEALKACEAAGEIYYIMLASMKLAITLKSQGRLQRTMEICRQQIQVAEECGLSQTSLFGLLLAILGEALAEINDLDEALHQAENGAKLFEHGVDMVMLGWGYMCLMRVLFSRRDLAGIQEIVQKVENIARESNVPGWVMNQLSSWQARAWLLQGDLEAASQWARGLGLTTDSENKPQHEINYFSLFDYIILARVMLAQGRLEEAAGLLHNLLEEAETVGRISRVIEILILQALVAQAMGETDRAMHVLEQALHLAEPEGFIRIFVDEGPPMARLLYASLSRGIAPDYISRLLAAFPIVEQEQTTSLRAQAPSPELIEPLSEREIEILQRIARGLTNPEIAARLYLSLNTVKVHTRNIYGKLGVNSRTQAVARARALGILPSS